MIPAGFYGIADATFGSVAEQVNILAGEGVAVVQVRAKAWPEEKLAAVLADLRGLGVQLVVNDRVDVARAAGLAVHLGQEDGPDPEIPFGRSCHTLAQVERCGAAVYIGFGPVFSTDTKLTGYEPRGLSRLREAVARSPVPVVAIGGITPMNVAAVRATGAAAWTAIGAVWRSGDPAAALRALGAPGRLSLAPRR